MIKLRVTDQTPERIYFQIAHQEVPDWFRVRHKDALSVSWIWTAPGGDLRIASCDCPEISGCTFFVRGRHKDADEEVLSCDLVTFDKICRVLTEFNRYISGPPPVSLEEEFFQRGMA